MFVSGGQFLVSIGSLVCLFGKVLARLEGFLGV